MAGVPKQRRSPRSRRAKVRTSQPQHLLSVAVVIAAVMAIAGIALSDAESMCAHHDHHHAAGQQQRGHARRSDRRGAAAGREQPRSSPPAANGAASACFAPADFRCKPSRSCRRVEVADNMRSRTSTANSAPRRRSLAAAARPTAAAGAFVASPALPAPTLHYARRQDDTKRAASASAADVGARQRRHRGHPPPSATLERTPWLPRFTSSRGIAASDLHAASLFACRPSPRNSSGNIKNVDRRTNNGRYFCSPGRRAPSGAFSTSTITSGGGGGGGSALCMGAGGEVAGNDRGRGFARPPLLITIGPQCAGKTTLLRNLAARSQAAARRATEETTSGSRNGSGALSITDITIDDHPSVYHKIPIGLLLDGCASGSPGDTFVGHRALSERLSESGCVETRLVALRLVGKISAREFADRLGRYGGQASPAALAALRSAVESAVSGDVRLSTPTVDVFVRESLFPGAISASQERLAVAARSGDEIVAWGNTNTQGRDFRCALEQAERTDRPVRFLRWGHELPAVSLEMLSRRNVSRFAATGRYVETAAVEAALSRIDKLYASTAGGEPARLALAAGFEMDAAGGVRSRSSRERHGSRSRGGSGRSSDRSGGGETGRTRRLEAGSPGGKDAVALNGGGDMYSVSGRNRQVDPLMPQPLPVGTGGRLAFTGAEHRRYDDNAARLGLAQEWGPRNGGGGRALAGTGAGAVTGTGAGSSRRWSYSDSSGAAGAAGVPPTVMFGNEWGRKRAWRRTGYTDDDIDPTMSSCFFRKPANSTGVLRRSDLGEGVGADFEEMELVKRIRSFRERR